MEVDEAALDRPARRPLHLRANAAPAITTAINRPAKDGRLRYLRRAAISSAAPDDKPEAVKTRLEAYRRQTAPILPYYRDKGILRRSTAWREIDAVTRQIEAILAGSVGRGPSV